MVSTGQGEVGAAKLSGEVLSIVAKVPELVKTMTGVDLIKVNINDTISSIISYEIFLQSVHAG